MQHRHLSHVDYTAAAIDDIIGRGGRKDWVALRQAAGDTLIRHKIRRVCEAYTSDPYAQRYHLWRHYVDRPSA